MRELIIFGLIAVTWSVAACKKDKVQPVPPPPAVVDTVSFSNVIEPLIQVNCSTSGCHDVSAAGGYNLLGYSSISDNASAILSVIKHEPGVVAMPLGASQLDATSIQDFENWIIQGKLDN